MPKPTDSQLKYSILLKSSFYPILFPQKSVETPFHTSTHAPLWHAGEDFSGRDLL